MNIEKLMRGLKTFTMDEIALIAEIEEVELQKILDDFIHECKLSFDGEVYTYIEPRDNFNFFELKQRPEFVAGSKILFKDIAPDFLSHQNLSLTTFKGYQYQIKSHLIPYFGKMFIDEITMQDILNFINEKQSRYSPKTISNSVTLLGTMLKDFFDGGLIPQNPYYGIKNSKIVYVSVKSELTILKINLLLKKAKKYPKLHKMLEFSIKTGLKKTEILAIDKNNVKNGEIRINKIFFEGKLLEHKKSKVVKMPVNFQLEDVQEKYLSINSFNFKLRKQFSEIAREVGCAGIKFDDIFKAKEAL